MELRDPIAAYNAQSNVEAHMVCNLLVEAGIEATVVEDVSNVGVWLCGLVPEIHKPQVWIDRSEIERARPVLEAHQQKVVDRVNPVETGETISAVCEECGRQTSFPASERGTVQSCEHCGAYVDVGDDSEFEDWADTDESEEAEEGSES